MHKCVRCGRAATSLQEINDGCPCGSKVFVFNKEAVQNSLSIAGEEMPHQANIGNGSPSGGAALGNREAPLPGAPSTGVAQPQESGVGIAPSVGSAPISGEKTVMAPGQKTEEITGGDGKMPESYHARMTFTNEDVENIKVVTEGVFMIELHSLYRDPVVLKDEEGVYYVKIPIREADGEAGEPKLPRIPFEQKGSPLAGNGNRKKK